MRRVIEMKVVEVGRPDAKRIAHAFARVFREEPLQSLGETTPTKGNE